VSNATSGLGRLAKTSVWACRKRTWRRSESGSTVADVSAPGARSSDLDDGLLEASEVAELKLNADWVVLSACNTASSDGVGAEPLSGLARAFLYAGGKSLVVSHWAVEDEATAKLMSNLFEIAKNKPNLSHGEMMRQATLSLLDAATTDAEPHPRVWAPFVVVGEPRTGREGGTRD
jgi:CHAT domain-containing protein